MAGVNVKMGVTGVSEFKRSMKDSESAVKSLNAQLALNESQLKLNGNAELYMENKVALLNQKIAAQASIAKSAQSALENMRKNGVSETSAAFQTMQTKLYNATNEMVKTKTELQNVKAGADGAKEGARGMNTELQKVGKGISWENVTNGIHSVTESLESAGRAAVSAGKKLLNSFTGATSWADDVTTRATKYGVSTEEIQQMDQVADIIDTDVDTIMTARNRLANNKKGLGELLGIEDTDDMSLEDKFWAAGDAIMAMTDEAERADKAQDVFGKSWQDLVPLFAAGRETYEEALNNASVLSDEQVASLSKADDTIKQLETQVENLKREFWAENADTITNMLQWLIDNKDGVVTALTAIAAAFGALKVAEFATNLMKIVNGFQTLSGLGGAGNGLSLPQLPTSGASAATSGLASKLGSFLGGAAVPLGVAALGIAPGVIAQNQTYAKEAETLNRRMSTAGSSNSAEALWLAQAAQALNIDWGKNADFGSIQSMLMGMGDRSDLQLSQLHTMLNGSTTSQGNYTWDELQRLWGGEEIDTGRMVAIMESVTDAYERLVSTQEENSKADENAVTSDDLRTFNGLPEQVRTAVQSGAQAGVSGIKVLLDGQAVGTLVAGYVSEAVAASIIGR